MSLKYPGVCRACSTPLAVRTQAFYDTMAKNVLCRGCNETAAASSRVPAPLPPPKPIDHGVAGAGPQREYERRVAKREAEIDALGGWRAKLVRAFDAEPQSTTAWWDGAEGERRLAAVLESGIGSSAVGLHSRRVPKTRGDIDHLVIAPSGVWSVDSKNYLGRPECRDVGGWRSPDWRLYVNGRDRSKVLDNFEWQVAAVRAVLDPMGFGEAPIHPTLVFTQWKKALFERLIELRGVRAVWMKKLVELIDEPGPLSDDAVRAIATQLSAKLPAKG